MQRQPPPICPDHDLLEAWSGESGTHTDGMKGSEPAAPERRLEFETFLANLSARFVALPPERVDDEIRSALHEVLGFFRIDRCSLLRLLPGKTLWLVTHNADTAGVSPHPVETPLPVSPIPPG